MEHRIRPEQTRYYPQPPGNCRRSGQGHPPPSRPQPPKRLSQTNWQIGLVTSFYSKNYIMSALS